MDPNLRRECAQRLLETADFIGGTNRTTAVTSTTQTTTTTSSLAPVMQQTEQTMQTRPNSATNRDTVRSEHTRLFGYRPPAPFRAPRNPRANSRGIRCLAYTNAAIVRASSTWSYLQSVLGQAKGYLRPLQRDIVMETRQGSIASPDKVCQFSSPTGK